MSTIEQNEKVYPVGLYSKTQRLQVFLLISITGVVLAGVFRTIMLFFRSYSMYSNIVALTVFGSMLILALVSLFVKDLNGWLKAAFRYVFPTFGTFVISLTLFIGLVEWGVMNINGIIGWFD